MSFRDYLRVASAAVTDVVRGVDQSLSSDSDYAAARKAFADKASEATRLARAKLEEVGKTDSGRKLGDRSRQVGAVVAKAPIISAIGDMLSQQAGIPELLELRAKNPEDPWPLIWLAEGLQRLNRSRNVFLTLRAPFEPLSAMAAVTARTTGTLGVDDPVGRCQQAAWSLAIAALHNDPTQLEHLHVLARVYLARGFAEQAAPLAAMAAVAETDGDLALVTVAIASKHLGRDQQAHAAAAEAVTFGCSLGHHTEAEYALDSQDYGRAIELRRLVISRDRSRYFGVDPTAASVLRGAASSQSAKTKSLAQSTRDFFTEEQHV